ncbi:MAG: radical SAM protein [Candidatus Omnitrophica bacterium]|nr:radical SAM protein [Candidatus Omnitrophota bacterium]
MIDVKDLFKEELVKEVATLDLEPFRASQILDWVYKKRAVDFDAMTNLTASAKAALKEKFYISGLELIKEASSKDGTIKFLLGLQDSQRIESVFIPSNKTNTVCVSSQVGCKFACEFCASGKAGFVRNLRPAEIINQVLFIQAAHAVTNVVFMGMGEPLDNYDFVIKAVRLLNAPYGLGIGQRKITIHFDRGCCTRNKKTGG